MSKSRAGRVVDFLIDFWPVRSDRLRADTRLEEDLGMTGDDAAEFLEAFAQEFEVNLAGIMFHKHFGPESGPILFMPRSMREEMRDLGKYPVTIGHLIDVAAAKEWFCPPQCGEGKWPSLPASGMWDRELDGESK